MKHFEINDGKGIIKLGFDEFDEFEHLSINQPITFLWKERYYEDSYDAYLSLLPIEDDNTFKLLNNSLDIDFELDYTDKENELFQSLRPFLSLFRNGKYGINFISQDTYSKYAPLVERLTFESIKKSNDNFDIDFSDGKIKTAEKRTGIYTINQFDFISIKSKSEIDWERVRFFENQIKIGKRPFAIIFSGHYQQEYFQNYILDGHHKIIAYQNLGMIPPYASISYFPENSLETGFDIEYLSQNFYLQNFYEVFQNWGNRKKYLEENTNSNLKKYVKNGKFHLYDSYMKISDGKYIDDLPDGEHRQFYSNGKLESVRNYNKGLNIGEWLIYDRAGLLTHENIFNEFHKQTSGKWFYEDKKMHENIWKYDVNGNLLFHKFFDEFDNLINETYYENNIPILYKSFERDGEIKELKTFDEVEKRLISVLLNEDVILEHSTEKYKDQKRRIKAWYEKNEENIKKYKEHEELRKKIDETIETMNFMDNIRIIALVIIVLIILFNFKSLFG